MPLTVLRSMPNDSPGYLVRQFHQAQLDWSRHLGEETELDFGRWISNPALPFSSEANCLLDAFLLHGISGRDIVGEMGLRSIHACTLNPSMENTRTASLAEALVAAGWEPRFTNILHRQKPIGRAVSPRPDLTIIPARASYRHYKQLMEERVAIENGTSADVAILHLDDSHLDGLLALQAGKPVGCIGVLSGGETGTIREWYVSPDHRRQGIGTLLLNRSIEICARSVFKHVLIGLAEHDAMAGHLCEQFGFAVIGQWCKYDHP